MIQNLLGKLGFGRKKKESEPAGISIDGNKNVAKQIFLSYSSEDKSSVEKICNLLESRGITCWMAPRDVRAGEDYGEQIIKAIESTKIKVLVLSTNSNTSKFVKNEVERAFSKGKTVITFKIHEVEPSRALELFTAGTHWIDAWNPPLESKVKVLSDTIMEYIGVNEIGGRTNKESNPQIQSSLSFQPAPNANPAVKTPAPAPTPAITAAQKSTPAVSSAPAVTLPSGEKTFTNSIGMEFVLIPAGEFDMGSQKSEKDRRDAEGPVHKVKISKAFYLGKFEVTQKQWREIRGNNPSYFKGDNLPVERVSWNDIQDFIKKLNEKESTNKYRLPSEAEWEYAARAGTTTRYSFGDEESKLGDYAWYSANSVDKPHDVGQKKPNPWGLYDMHGNVFEWVQDKWNNNYDGAPTDGSSWEENGSGRVNRGGGYDLFAGYCRSAVRGGGLPGLRHSVLGFRLLRIS